MSRVLFLVSIALFFSVQSFSQISDLVFLGAVSVKGGETYTYKLQVTDSNGILKGYSITDVMGKNETKTAVVGSIDVAKKQVNYRETKIIYTKADVPQSDFCYLHAHLKVSNVQGATTLKGHFTGYKDDGKTKVASGKVALVSAQDVLDKLLQIATKDSIEAAKKQPTPKEVIYLEEKQIPESSIKKVKHGDTIILTCQSPTVTIDVWDAKTIDGDIVTISQDNKAILENYTLSGSHKQLSLTPITKNSTLTLMGVSEGSEPLTTARLKISSGDDSYYVDATTTIGKSVVVILKRK